MKKWFKFNGTEFYSIKKAKNIDEAWDKTLQKWSLKESGYKPSDSCSTCGICDLFRIRLSCNNCFLYFDRYGVSFIESETFNSCVPFKDPSEQLLWLLFVKEATK